MCARERALALKPATVTFEQAAAVPVAGCTALQGLRDKGRIQPGQRVLINGAAGGVGTFAVQLAKSFGADVTGVCSTRNMDMVRSIGADRVVDYTRDDFTRGPERYDLTSIGREPSAVGVPARHAAPRDLRHRRGIRRPMAWTADRWAEAIVLSRFVSQNLLMFLASINIADLMVLKGLIEAGNVTPVIDRRYPLTEVPAAIRYLEEGHARGKVVISL